MTRACLPERDYPKCRICVEYTAVTPLRYDATHEAPPPTQEARTTGRRNDLRARESRTLIRNVGLVSAGVTVVAVGLVVGRELRQRYKFSRRTPYDLYAHSGDSMQDVEFGVGI
jgi:hypothetical protein